MIKTVLSEGHLFQPVSNAVTEKHANRNANN